MSIRSLLTISFAFSTFGLFSQNNYTPTYNELLTEYRALNRNYTSISKLDSFEVTDRGIPLHLLIISADGVFSRNSLEDRTVVLIMNGIHPGEPCGINASLDFARAKLESPDKNVVYCIIPVYNIGGMLNRGSYSRANQVGPNSYGFRGNTKNLDLNRDFIKADSRNVMAFYKIFHHWRPNIFIDTHTSNGADYQPTLTLLSSFPENMEPEMGSYLTHTMEPALYTAMKSKGEEMVPYVNVFRTTPDSGFKAFTDHPRYSTGFASLFNTIGFTTEAHMLKPFHQRVKATLKFLNVIADFSEENYEELIQLKNTADSLSLKRTSVPFNWKVSEKADSIEFPGYAANMNTISQVTLLPTLRYDRSNPYRKKIPFFKHHQAEDEYDIPSYYVLSGAWTDIIQLLDLNQVAYEELKNDTAIEVRSIYIDTYKSYDKPYEGHFKHYEIQTTEKIQSIQFFPGDVIVPTNQPAIKYLAHIFNPKAADSFFSWNFFDSCLMRKEYFSSYVFDQTAAELLKANPELGEELEEMRKSNPDFAANSREQLRFIYERSPYYEESHRRLPVYELD